MASCSHTCASVTKQYNLVPDSPLGRKQAHRVIHWLVLHCKTMDTDPWSCSVKTGVWLRALGNGDQIRPMGRKAREGLYFFITVNDNPPEIFGFF